MPQLEVHRLEVKLVPDAFYSSHVYYNGKFVRLEWFYPKGIRDVVERMLLFLTRQRVKSLDCVCWIDPKVSDKKLQESRDILQYSVITDATASLVNTDTDRYCIRPDGREHDEERWHPFLNDLGLFIWVHTAVHERFHIVDITRTCVICQDRCIGDAYADPLNGERRVVFPSEYCGNHSCFSHTIESAGRSELSPAK